MRFKVIVCLVTILCYMSLSTVDTHASTAGSVSFQGAGVVIDMEFPEEAHPTDSITLNVTVTAMLALHLQNFTLVINVLVDTGWQQIYKEQVLGLAMVQNQVLVRLIWFTLPQNAQGALYCYMYVQTDKAPGLPSTYIFHATQVRTMTYDELLANYNRSLTDYGTLLNSYDALLTQYNGLNSTYNLLLNQYTSLQASLSSLNSSYFTQKGNYDTLRTSYNSLEASYKALNQTYHSLMTDNDSLRNMAGTRDTELTMTRYGVYALIAVAVALMALVIYSRKKKSEPYIVLRKETVSVKPQANVKENSVPEMYLA